jgi:hypothetical protein
MSVARFLQRSQQHNDRDVIGFVAHARSGGPEAGFTNWSVARRFTSS